MWGDLGGWEVLPSALHSLENWGSWWRGSVQVWRPENLGGRWCKSCSLRVGEPRALMSKDRRRWISQLQEGGMGQEGWGMGVCGGEGGRERKREKGKICFFAFPLHFFFLVLFRPSTYWMVPPSPTILHENGSFLLSLLIQMPVSSRNSLTAMLSSNVLTAVWVSLNSFKLKP